MLEVREQPRLSLPKLLRICRLSIAHRLLRSSVTVAIIALAIAFLASIMTSAALGRAARDEALREADRRSAYSRFVSALQPWTTQEPALRWLAAAEGDPSAPTNFATWSGLPASTAPLEARRAAAFVRFLGEFEALPAGQRILLAENRKGVPLLDWLVDTSPAFTEQLAKLPSARLTRPDNGWLGFFRDWPAAQDTLKALREGRARSLGQAREAIGPETIEEAMVRAATADAGTQLFADLAANGLDFSADEREAIAREASFEARLSAVLDVVRAQEVRSRWRAAFQQDYSPTVALEAAAVSPAKRKWMADQLGDRAINDGEFAEVAALFLSRQQAFEASQLLVARYGEKDGIDSRTNWLVAVSFLVCVVGIANAMLMSVLERFKEIATMKCLGARNGTIGFLFIFESLAMGLLGGLAGIVVACAVTVGPGLLAHGHWLARNFPAGELVEIFGWGLAAGLALSGIAAIYPALVAAKMEPLEAMRVD